MKPHHRQIRILRIFSDQLDEINNIKSQTSWEFQRLNSRSVGITNFAVRSKDFSVVKDPGPIPYIELIIGEDGILNGWLEVEIANAS